VVGCHYFPPGPSAPESSTLTTRLSSHPMFKDICDFLCLERQQRPMGRGIKWLHKIIQQLLPSMHEISRVQLCGTRTAPGSRRCMRQMPLQSESVQYTAPLHCDLVTHTHARTHAHTHTNMNKFWVYTERQCRNFVPLSMPADFRRHLINETPGKIFDFQNVHRRLSSDYEILYDCI